jgi:hypothetical protein
MGEVLLCMTNGKGKRLENEPLYLLLWQGLVVVEGCEDAEVMGC